MHPLYRLAAVKHYYIPSLSQDSRQLDHPRDQEHKKLHQAPSHWEGGTGSWKQATLTQSIWRSSISLDTRCSHCQPKCNAVAHAVFPLERSGPLTTITQTDRSLCKSKTLYNSTNNEWLSSPHHSKKSKEPVAKSHPVNCVVVCDVVYLYYDLYKTVLEDVIAT